MPARFGESFKCNCRKLSLTFRMLFLWRICHHTFTYVKNLHSWLWNTYVSVQNGEQLHYTLLNWIFFLSSLIVSKVVLGNILILLQTPGKCEFIKSHTVFYIVFNVLHPFFHSHCLPYCHLGQKNFSSILYFLHYLFHYIYKNYICWCLWYTHLCFHIPHISFLALVLYLIYCDCANHMPAYRYIFLYSSNSRRVLLYSICGLYTAFLQDSFDGNDRAINPNRYLVYFQP